MRVYVETNFVLEVALAQEQQADCEEILRLAETEAIDLVLPAFSLVEPYETLVRRHRQRERTWKAVDDELIQLKRSAGIAVHLGGIDDLRALLIDSADEEAKRLEALRARLVDSAEVIPLDSAILRAAARFQRSHNFSPPDSIVYASVDHHLSAVPAPLCCFLNRNKKDFEDPIIVEELKRHGCTLIPHFGHGLRHIRSRLK